jgi:hypothetical protein
MSNSLIYKTYTFFLAKHIIYFEETFSEIILASKD